MDLRSTQLKDTYGNLVTTGTTAGSPTTGGLQNGQGTLLTSVGIGTNSTSAKLTLNDAGQQVGIDFKENGTTRAHIEYDGSLPAFKVGTNGGAYLSLRTNNDEKLRIEADGDIAFYDDANNQGLFWDASAGSLGIGTTSTTGKLTVSSGTAGGGYNSDYDELVLTNSGRSGINILSGATDFSAIIMGGKADNSTGGIFHNASTNMLSLSTQDAFRLNIDSSGNVGIGTTDPQAILNNFSASARGIAIENGYPMIALSDTGNSSFKSYIGTDSGELYVWNAATGPTVFATNNTERLRIESNGNAILNTDTSNTAKSIRIGSIDGTSGWSFGNGVIADSHQFVIYDNTAGSSRLLIDSSGNVGIGETSPTATLNIKSASSNNADNLAQVLTNSEFRLQYRSDDLSSLYIGGLGSEKGYLQGVNNAQDAGVDISLNPYGGNVGIGTNTPSATLDVKGTMSLQATNSTNKWLAYTYTDNTLRLNYNGAGNDEVLINSSGQVGIGVSPLAKLHVNDTTYPSLRLSTATSYSNIYHDGTTGSITYSADDGNAIAGSSHQFYVDGSSAMTIDSSGNVNITTGNLILDSGAGIDFSATADGSGTMTSELLDDYEEGTWTIGVSFSGAAVGVTTTSNTGKYTKIGRQVTLTGYLVLTSKGSSTGNATITGLPFTIGNNNANYSAPSLWFYSITFANILFANGTINSTSIALQESTEAGVNSNITDADFANNSEVVLSFTYFV
jgi:hypothetical protein